MLSLNISEELRQELEQMARQQGVVLDELVEHALQDFVEKEKAVIRPGIVSLQEVLDEAKKLGLPPKPPLKLNVHDSPDFPTNTTFRREEMYDDRD